jgi:hypothetical protein
MSEVIRHADTCIVKHAKKSSMSVEAVVSQFIVEQQLDVILNKSVKLKMIWNGRCYEGRGSGIDLVSDGPKVTKTQTGIRG